MVKRVNKTRMEVKGKVVNIGIDVHKRSWHVTAIIDGVIVVSVSTFPQYEAFKKLLVRFKGAQVRVAYEAGPAGFNLYDRLTADGIECIVTPPSLIPTESGNKVKTDKIDSRKLAILLSGHMLKKVWVLSVEERAHRQLVRIRRQICNHRANVMRQIKSFLLFHGMGTPYTDNRNWTLCFVNWLRGLDLGNAYLNHSFKALPDLFDYLTEEKKRLTQEVGKLSRTEKYAQKVQLLLSIPGVGVLSAMEILVELQDMNRFERADDLAAYLGLTPSQYSSGERIRMGHITHTGNRIIRTTLVESSWFLIAKDPWMYEKYHKIKIRRGGKKAIVAVARKLSIRIRRMLLDGVPYKMAQSKIA